MDEALKSKLMAAAQALAAERGWPWLEPIEIRPAVPAPGREVWTIRTNASSRGMNILISIRESDLVILDAAFLPR